MQIEITQPPKATVVERIETGATQIDFDLSEAEKSVKVFAFISGETKQTIQTQMKQMITNMDVLERKHYEQKLNQLGQEIETI